MLKCRDIAHQASDYLDGNQTLRQRLSVAMHLLICGKCRAFIKHMRTALEFYRHMPAQTISDNEAMDIADKVMADHPKRIED